MLGVCHNFYQQEIFMKLNLQRNLIKTSLRTSSNNICENLLEF